MNFIIDHFLMQCSLMKIYFLDELAFVGAD